MCPELGFGQLLELNLVERRLRQLRDSPVAFASVSPSSIVYPFIRPMNEETLARHLLYERMNE